MFGAVVAGVDFARGGGRRLRRVLGTAAPVALTPVVLATGLLALPGCTRDRQPVTFLGEPQSSADYVAHATNIAYPAIVTQSPETVAATLPPHTLDSRDVTDVYDLSLQEAIRRALENNEIFRANGTFLGGGGVLGDINGVQSLYDPALQETSIALGQGGVESALAAFDASLGTSMFWTRDESVSNFAGNIIGQTTEAATFNATLGKVFGTGASLALGHTVNYTGIGQAGGFGGGGFGFGGGGPASTYSGNTAVQFRQPLLAGAGTEYTRIAGPRNAATSNLQGVTGGIFGGGAGGFAGGLTTQLAGVSNGVVIARINTDISLTQFEAAVRDLVRDTEQVYWDLYLAYRNFDTAVTQRNSALQTWRVAKTQRELEADILPAEEAQARDQYFESESQVQTARSRVFEVETQLRRLLNMPVSDGLVLRPADDPVTAELIPEWYACLSDALSNRVELRRRKWDVKSLQLQLKAARNLLRPELDFVAGYQVNGFGDRLLGYDEERFENFYQTQTDGNLTGWQLGFTLSTPVGRRRAHAQVRNIELRLAKAQKTLAVGEHEVSQELAAAFQSLARTRANVRSQYSRRAAAIENVALLEPLLVEGEITLDEVLRAQARRAQAESSFYTALVAYNQALLDLQYRKGTLLAYDNVRLIEGPWHPQAYCDARTRAEARAHGKPTDWKSTDPDAFASPGNPDPVSFTAPMATQMGDLGVVDGFIPAGSVLPPMPSDDAEATTPLPLEEDDARGDDGPSPDDASEPDVWDLDSPGDKRPGENTPEDAGVPRLPELTDLRGELIGPRGVTQAAYRPAGVSQRVRKADFRRPATGRGAAEFFPPEGAGTAIGD